MVFVCLVGGAVLPGTEGFAMVLAVPLWAMALRGSIEVLEELAKADKRFVVEAAIYGNLASCPYVVVSVNDKPELQFWLPRKREVPMDAGRQMFYEISQALEKNKA
jgi:hypothetical protein